MQMHNVDNVIVIRLFGVNFIIKIKFIGNVHSNHETLDFRNPNSHKLIKAVLLITTTKRKCIKC